MYKYINEKTGETIGYAAEPIYIRWNSDSQCYIQVAKRRAHGVAINGTPYNLFPRAEFENVESVIEKDCDIGNEVYDLIAENEQLKADNDLMKILLDIHVEEDANNEERIELGEEVLS